MSQYHVLEYEYFTWEDWGCCDFAAFNFSNVTLKKKIGEYEKGTKFE